MVTRATSITTRMATSATEFGSLTTIRREKFTVSRHTDKMPFRKIFLSRWSALLWAGGIVWTAVDTVGFASEKVRPAAASSPAVQDANGDAVTAHDLEILANSLKNS